MITADLDISGWNAKAARYVTELGIDGQKVIKTQAGLLVRTLINLTPPRKLGESQKAIDHNVKARFGLVSSLSTGFVQGNGGKAGHGDVRWLFSTPHLLMGVEKDRDMTKAGSDELYKLYFAIRQRRGYQERGLRGKQSVRIWQKVTTTEKQSKQVANRVKAHLGRQKAGWLPSYDELRPAGAAPPQWVTRHRQGARGTFLSGLMVPGAPSVTLVNRAFGIEKSAIVVKQALQVRERAMVKDIDLYLKGVKKKADFK
jgi:hypothetical protein